MAALAAKITKRLATTLWLAALAFGLAAVTKDTWAFAKRDYAVLAVPPLVELDPRLIGVVTLGHRELFDDLIYLWTLQTLVDPRTKTKDPVEVQKAILAVTRHGPKVEALYMLSCFVLSFDLKRPELCERISLDGLKALPEGWRIPMTQAFIYAYEMNDPKNAAMYYGLAASRADAPEYAGSFAVKLIETNQLSVSDLRATLDGLLGTREGSRFAEFLGRLAPRAPGERS